MTAPPSLRFAQELTATLRLAAPLAAASLAQMGMGLTDTILLGTLGRDALAAGGLGASLFFTLAAVTQGLLASVGILIAHAQGARDLGRTAPIFRAGMVLATMAAVPIALLMWTIEPILLVIGEPPLLAAAVADYVQILALAAPPSLWLATQRAYLAAINQPAVVMAVALGALVMNGVLNYGLMHGVWGLPEMGYLGSATASTISLWTMAGTTALILRATPALRSHLFAGPVSWPIVAELAHLGWPIVGTLAVEIILFLVGGLMMGMLGNTALAAHTVALNVASITFMVPLATGQAANVRVGFHLGAGDKAGARRAGIAAFALGVGFMAMAALLLFAAPFQIALLFNLDPASAADAPVIALVVRLLVICAFFQIFDGAQTIAAGVLRGYKDTRVPMMLAAFSYWGVGFPTAWTLGFPMGFGPQGIWWGLALGLAAAAAVLGTRFARLSVRY